MRRYSRSSCPPELKEKWGGYTMLYIGRIKKKKGTFYWNKYPNSKGQEISKFILPTLLTDTQEHCAYCDKFPLFKSDKTIDHFKPKTAYPIAAYQWENLFPACDNCQTAKMDKFSCDLLKPDDLAFRFDKFFIIDYVTFELLPNPIAHRYDRKRARYTINTLCLNDLAHCISREQFLHLHRTGIYQVNDLPYRYLFE